MDTKLGIKKKSTNKEVIFPIVIIFCLSLLFTFFMSKILGDDLAFLERLNSLGYIKASTEYYFIWSSRTTIEFFLMFFSKHFFLWQLINPFIMTGTVILINQYTLREVNGKNLFLVFSLYAMIPLTLMKETGWVATTLNYHWALFFALLAFYPFFKALTNEPIPISLWIISILSLICSATQEQINLCFLVFTSIISVYLVKKNRYDYKLSLLTLISVIGLLLFVLSPGNSVRYIKNVEYWFPEYTNYSLINKLDLGISSFGKPFFVDSNILFFILFALVAFLVYKKCTNYYLTLLCGLPLAFNFIIYLGGTMKTGFSFYGSNGSTAIFSSNSLNDWFTKTGTGLSLTSPVSWLPTLLILFFVACLTIGLFLSFDNHHKGIVACLLFLMAFSSRLIMGFSPTVWASGVRTYFIVFIVAVILILLLISELKKISINKTNAVIFILTIIGFSTFFLSVFSR